MKYAYELNLKPSITSEELLCYVKRGYTRFAVNTMINVNEFDIDNEKRKNIKNEMRQKMEQKLMITDCKYLINEAVKIKALKFYTDVVILNRVTMISEDVNKLKLFIHEMKKSIAKFDLISILPLTNEVLALACEEISPLEIVTIDLNSTNIKFADKYLALCLKRSIIIELDLSPVIAGSVPAKNNLSRMMCDTTMIGQNMLTLKDKHLFSISNGNTDFWGLKNPLSLECLMRSFGLNYHYSTIMLRDVPELAVKRGLTRRKTIYGASVIITSNENNSDNSMQVQ